MPRSRAEAALGELRAAKLALQRAVAGKTSRPYSLRLWSYYVRLRDRNRCVRCGDTQSLNAHHIVRRTLYPAGSFELGNGITLCRACHHEVHEEFNGRPNLNLPLGAEGGDDQDYWAHLFCLLFEDANSRKLDHDEFYWLDDHMISMFVAVQGYREQAVHLLSEPPRMSRLGFAFAIWRRQPEVVYQKLFAAQFPARSETVRVRGTARRKR